MGVLGESPERNAAIARYDARRRFLRGKGFCASCFNALRGPDAVPLTAEECATAPAPICFILEPGDMICFWCFHSIVNPADQFLGGHA